MSCTVLPSILMDSTPCCNNEIKPFPPLKCIIYDSNGWRFEYLNGTIHNMPHHYKIEGNTIFWGNGTGVGYTIEHTGHKTIEQLIS